MRAGQSGFRVNDIASMTSTGWEGREKRGRRVNSYSEARNERVRISRAIKDSKGAGRPRLPELVVACAARSHALSIEVETLSPGSKLRRSTRARV